jgi:hypothetical protein
MRIRSGDNQIVADDGPVALGQHITAAGHQFGGQVTLVFAEVDAGLTGG